MPPAARSYLVLYRQTLQQRRIIDKKGRGADCAADATLAESPGLSSWLRAWCGVRTQDYALASASAQDALRYFEALGDFRRQAELHFVRALSASKQQDPSQRYKSHHEAVTLMRAAQLKLNAEVDDPLPADLPFLAAELARALGGAVAMPSPRGPLAKLHAPTLFELAIDEHTRTQEFAAAAHDLRAYARWALDEGALNLAASLALKAQDLELEQQNPDGLHANALLFADMALVRGMGPEALLAESWLVQHMGPDYFPAPYLLPALPEDSSQLSQLLAQRETRQALLRSLRSLRRDAKRSLHPPARLIETLRQHERLDLFRADTWELSYEIAQLLFEQGHTRDAQRYFKHAVTRIEQLRQAMPTLEQRQRFLAQYREVYVKLIHTFVGVETAKLTQQDYNDALFYAGALKARGVLDLLNGLGPSATTRSLAPPNALVTRSIYELSAWTRGHLEQWAAPLKPTAPLQPSDARALSLAQGTALVEYLIGQRAGYVWVLRHDGQLHMRRLAGRQRLAPMIERLQKLLTSPSLSPEQEREYIEQAERLYVELVGPIQDLVAQQQHLIVATDAALQELPFEALLKPTKDKTPRPLIEELSLSYVPSSRALKMLLQRPRAIASNQALLIGAPTLTQRAQELDGLTNLDLSGQPSLRLDALFPHLPGAQQELRELHRSLRAKGQRSSLYLGAQATEAPLFAKPAPLSLLHIATHGLSDTMPLGLVARTPTTFKQPALLLATGAAPNQDGLLRIEEILAQQIAAQTVVLSGCATGRGWQLLGDGAFGLAGAFLVAGSQAVVASVWSVADRPTSILMRHFYKHLLAKQSPAQALQLAQRELLRLYKPAGARILPPYYWASFRVIGAR